MAIQHGKPNPLDYFDLRRVEFACPHFKYTTLNKYSPTVVSLIDKWIRKNLNGRYYIGQGISLDNNNSIIYTTQIGFESEKDVSFFIIACPHLQVR
jgi:hypothetical protein